MLPASEMQKRGHKPRRKVGRLEKLGRVKRQIAPRTF